MRALAVATFALFAALTPAHATHQEAPSGVAFAKLPRPVEFDGERRVAAWFRSARFARHDPPGPSRARQTSMRVLPYGKGGMVRILGSF